MTGKAVPIRFEDLDDIQMQLMFEEAIFDGFERVAVKYCRWLLKMNEEQRRLHHRSLSRIAHTVRNAHGQIIDMGPECSCEMCSQWHAAAVQELWGQYHAEDARREAERATPKPKKPTFIYLIRNEKSGLVKIGRSKTPDSRERTLQSEEPYNIMFFSAPGDSSLELLLHNQYAKHRVRGEWFQLSEQQVEDIKLRVLSANRE